MRQMRVLGATMHHLVSNQWKCFNVCLQCRFNGGINTNSWLNLTIEYKSWQNKAKKQHNYLIFGMPLQKIRTKQITIYRTLRTLNFRFCLILTQTNNIFNIIINQMSIAHYTSPHCTHDSVVMNSIIQSVTRFSWLSNTKNDQAMSQ